MDDLDLGVVVGILPPSGVGPDVGVDTIPPAPVIDEEFLPPVIGEGQGPPPPDPDLPGPDFGVHICQGFPPSIL